ncbi:MAG: LytS/YhcK type 5TM receptor domain-containing protein [Methanolobus sp.]|uniref:LytS/YhcK type 5TM receptor domain-containing protein n=1 Tax=Methanolobus sp. TaxID=1874737 RepID=UPI0027318D12|nr:LytS/YhcK type 5TM receptor domain-containing protein [Methanolobus sp.]MDP2217503.1 LytS/YhcK type 5TM receptor domain-containing protein [Methanolobus sp.]
MNHEPLAGIISNAALLLALWVIYEATFLNISISPRLKKMLVGIIIGFICIALMMNPWELVPGLFFDTRSILLGITGLFFGLVPTIIAMSIAAIFRLYQGGAGVWMGVSVIITSSMLGLFWNRYHEKLKRIFGRFELYAFGLTIHITMLLCTFILPWQLAIDTLSRIILPVLVIYPLVTVLLGNMMNCQIDRENSRQALRESEEIFGLFMDNFPGYAYIKDEKGRHLFCNKKLEERVGLEIPHLLGKSNEDLFPPDVAKQFSANDQLVLQNKGTLVVEEELIQDDGTQTFLSYKFVITRKHGSPYLGGISLDITDRKRADEKLKLYNQRLNIFHRIDKGIISAHSSREIACTVLKCMRRIIACSNVHLMLFEKNSAEAYVFAADGEMGPAFSEGMLFRVSMQKQLSELSSGYIISFKDLPEFEGLFSPLSGHIPKDTFHSGISAPLILEGELMGALNLLAEDDGFFHDEHLEIVREIAAQLAVAIQQARLNEQIKRHSCDLEESVRQRTFQLEAANKELEAFAYSVSHDLRSPLRAIDGFSRIILEDYADKLDEEGNRLLSVVRDNAQKMDKLITDLLSLSRVSRNEMNLTNIDMAGMAESVFKELTSPEIKARFNVSINQMPEGCADPVLMKQVWSNLLANAIKYTMPVKEPVISIGGYRENGRNVYYVKDTGVGFDPKYVHKLFGLFQRLHTEKEFEGTGVGLAIMQRIVHRHGGTVWAEGKVNEGATFYFSLPAKEDYSDDRR